MQAQFIKENIPIVVCGALPIHPDILLQKMAWFFRLGVGASYKQLEWGLELCCETSCEG